MLHEPLEVVVSRVGEEPTRPKAPARMLPTDQVGRQVRGGRDLARGIAGGAHVSQGFFFSPNEGHRPARDS
eukprot:5452931-Prymnesium_polylepis.1